MNVLPTKFHGIEYRSRTEAMWAAYFWFTKTEFIYEPEAFNLGVAGCYLPDFFLPSLDSFVEIKPTFVMSGRESPCAELAIASNKKVILIHGRPKVFGQDGCDYENPQCFFPDGGADHPYWPCVCPHCGAFGFEYSGWAGRLKCCKQSSGDRDPNHEAKIIADAVEFSLQSTKWKP